MEMLIVDSFLDWNHTKENKYKQISFVIFFYTKG